MEKLEVVAQTEGDREIRQRPPLILYVKCSQLVRERDGIRNFVCRPIQTVVEAVLPGLDSGSRLKRQVQIAFSKSLLANRKLTVALFTEPKSKWKQMTYPLRTK